MNDNNPIYNNNPMNDNDSPQNNPMHEEPVIVPVTGAQPMAATRENVGNGALHWLQEEEVQELQSRWMGIQTQFVDEPRSSVEQADALVADAMDRIQRGFANKRSLLDQHWMNHDDVSTEDLRTILQDYRSFFNRLLAL